MADAHHNIIHIGKVPLAITIVKDPDRFAFQKFIGKAEIGHIRSACRAVDREKTQPRGGDVI